MKKVLVGLLIVIIVIISCAFIFIPQQLRVSEITLTKANQNSLYRYLSNENKWEKWWPSKNSNHTNQRYSYNGFNYILTKVLYNAVEISISNNNQTFNGRVVLLPISPDTIAIKWESSFAASNNPFARIINYQEAKTIKNNMQIILDSLKAFSENDQRVYAYNIHRTTLKDTVLVATKLTTKTPPTTDTIYSLVRKLEKYIASQGAKETNYPMLNVTINNNNNTISYTIMVAIATDRTLNEKEDISPKRLIPYKDKIVTAEVRGGNDSIKKAYDELNLYMSDFNLTTPVIPWEYLITDRSKEKDSTKWITRIYMPVV